MKTRIIFAGTAAVVLIGIFTTVSAQEAQNAERLRAEAAQLTAKAQDLKAEGSAEEATKLAKAADKLHLAAAKLEKQASAKHDVESEARRDVKHEVNELRARLKELESDGKMDEAVEVKRRLSELEDRFRKRPMLARKTEREEDKRAEARARERERRGQVGELRREPRAEGAPREFADSQRRLQHLTAAIENLHAAGMPEPAEHLEREAQRMRHQLEREGGPVPPAEPRKFDRPDRLVPPPPARFGREPNGIAPSRPEAGGPQGVPMRVAELQNEVRDLRQAVQDLRKRLDEMSRERR